MTPSEHFWLELASLGLLFLIFIGIPAAIFYVVTSINKNRRRK
jgi:hypothetical protein